MRGEKTLSYRCQGYIRRPVRLKASGFLPQKLLKAELPPLNSAPTFRLVSFCLISYIEDALLTQGGAPADMALATRQSRSWWRWPCGRGISSELSMEFVEGFFPIRLKNQNFERDFFFIISITTLEQLYIVFPHALARRHLLSIAQVKPSSNFLML